MDKTLQNFKEAKVDFAAIQECRSTGKGDFEMAGYDCYYSGFENGFPPGGAQQGVMICVRKSGEIIVTDVQQLSPRLMFVDAMVHGIRLRYFSAYAPHDGRPENEKDDFWSLLSEQIKNTPKKRQISLNGDFNATTTAIRCGVTRFHGQELPNVVSNDNGHRLIRFLAENRLHVASTYYRHKVRHSMTHYGAQGYRKILDLCLNNNFLQKRCLDSRVRCSYDFDSDHKLLVTRFKVDRDRKQRKNRKPLKTSTKRCDFKAVTNQHKQQFLGVVEAGQYNSASQIIGSLENACNELPKVSKNPKFQYPWNNDETLQALFAERKEHGINGDKQLYRQVGKIIRLRVRALRNEHYANEAAQFNDALSRRQVEKCYSIAKAQATTRRNKVKKETIPGLLSHYEQHFNHVPPTVTPLILQQPRPQPPNPIHVETTAPTPAEITNIIMKAKSGKSSLDIPMDVMKLALESESFLAHLTLFYKHIWVNTDVPAYLGESMIIAIWKNKGSRSDPATWRGIMLSSILTKIMSCIFVSRIKTAYNKNLGQGQMGFRDGRGCQDGNYCLKRMHQWSRKVQRELYVGMVDLSSAFDWVSRELTWESVRHVIGDSILISIMVDMYEKTTAYMRDDTTKRFKSTCGVRQGGTESPYAYNCLAQKCLDTFDAMCEINEKINDFKIPFKIPKSASKSGDEISGEFSPCYLGYADDLVIWAFTATELELKLNILWDVFTEFGLHMNLKKTETLIYNWKLGQVPVKEKIPYVFYPTSICTINKLMLNPKNGKYEQKSINIKNVKKFKYLGALSQVDDCSIGNEELQNRLTSATCKFFELKQFFTNRKIDLTTRIQYFRSLVLTRLTYLCGSWTITDSQLEQIESKRVKLLRYMVKGGNQRTGDIQYTRKNGTIGEYHKLIISNQRIRKLTKTESIKSYINKQQENWVGHCIRAEDDTYIKMFTFPDYYKGESKKRGRLNTVYSQVLAKYKKENENRSENDMLTELRNRNSLEVTGPSAQ